MKLLNAGCIMKDRPIGGDSVEDATLGAVNDALRSAGESDKDVLSIIETDKFDRIHLSIWVRQVNT